MADTKVIEYKDLGFANQWTQIPKVYQKCLLAQHNHRHILLTGGLHKIQCDECAFEFTEEGEAPLLKRELPLPPPAPTPASPVDVQAIIHAAVGAALAAVEAREKAKEQRK